VSWNPQAVLADSEDDAIQKYLKVIYSKDDVFRESVLDLAINVSFVEQFYLSSEHEKKRFCETGTTGLKKKL
jgi:hypothetical protein